MSKNILYFTRTMGLGGTEKVILQLCQNNKINFDNIIVCSCGGAYEKELENMNIKHYTISDIENKNIIVFIKTLKRLKSIVRAENINIIHSHHRMAAFYCRVLKIFLNFNFIHTAHNTFFDKKNLTKFALNDANIIAVGDKVKENLVDFYNIDSTRIEVIYNGVAQYNNSFKEIEQLSELSRKGYFLIGNIGRISEQKGMEYFVRAIPYVLEKNKKVKFFIIGDGELRNKLEKIVDELHIREYILFLGFRDDVSDIIKALDLIVLSSLWEGLPLTPIEVFAQKKAIIATNVDGTPEIISDGYNGILVQPKNSHEIYKGIMKVMMDKAFKEKIEKNGYKTYNEKFSIDIFNKSYENYYRKIIK